MYNEDMIQKMRDEIPFLKSVTEEDLKKVLQQSKIMQYKPGEIIMEEGSYDDWIYYLVSGKVRIVKQGKEVYVTQRTGEIFGEMSVIDGSARSASVFAVENTMCLAIDISHIDKNLIYRDFAIVLAGRLRVTTEELIQTKKELEQLNLTRRLITMEEELRKAKEKITKLTDKTD